MAYLTYFSTGDDPDGSQHRWITEFRRLHFELRYEALKNSGWKDPDFDHAQKRETDEIDYGPDVVYFITHNSWGEAMSALRMERTDVQFRWQGQIRSCMLRDTFNGRLDPKRNLLYKGTVAPRGAAIRELSRLVVHPALRAEKFREVRSRLVDQQVLACLQYARAHDIEKLVFVARSDLLKVWTNRGLKLQYLGPEKTIDDNEKVRAVQITVTPRALDAVREKTRMRTAGGPMLSPPRYIRSGKEVLVADVELPEPFRT